MILVQCHVCYLFFFFLKGRQLFWCLLFLAINPLQKGLYYQRKEFAPLRVDSFLEDLTPIEKRGEYEKRMDELHPYVSTQLV